MAKPTLTYKDELTQEPDYNGTQNEAGAAAQSCPQSNEEPRQKITAVYFEDGQGNKLQNILKEEEVNLVVETENMEGEELVLALGKVSESLELEGEALSQAKALVYNVGAAVMRTTLKVMPQRLKTVKQDKPVKPASGKGKAVAAEVEKPTVESIEFLDGDDVKTVSGKVSQFVNLPQKLKWVDGTEVLNLDRLSNRPRLFVKFDQEGAHKVKVKWVPKSGNLEFSDTEKARNGLFDFDDEEKEYTTEIDGTLIIDDLKISIATGNEFSVQATDDDGNKVKSKGSLLTKKLFYITQIKMKNLTSIASSIGTFTSEYDRHRIALPQLPDTEMEHMENISTGDQSTFKSKAKVAYAASSGPGKEPYSMTVAYTDHLAVKKEDQELEKTNVDVGTGKPKVDFQIEGPGDTNPAVKGRALWKDLVTGEDWFVSCTFLKDGGAAADLVDVPKTKCKAKQKAGYPTGYCDKVEVDVSGLDTAKGTLTLTVNWVDRMRGGLAFGGNFTCVCTKAWWQTKSGTSQNQVIIHEIGHKIGMACDGSGKKPDKISTLYTSAKGHVGNHCHKGIAAGQTRYDSSTDAASSTCVMYGATNGKTRFCASCKPTVRKSDLSKGWTAF